MHAPEYEIMRQKFNGKLAVKNSFVFVWLVFVIFIGILIVAYVWNLDIEDGWRWTAFALILTLSILLLVVFLLGYWQGRLPRACINKVDLHNKQHNTHTADACSNGYRGTRVMNSSTAC